jgi:predicted RNA-binding Zn ribbon-like protein
VNSNQGQGLGLPDVLADPTWVADYLRHWRFDEVGAPRPGDLARLRQLRALLRRLVDGLDAGKTLTRVDRAELEGFLVLSAYRRQLADSSSLALVPERRDWNWVLAEIAAAFAEALVLGTERIKACDNPDCRFAFVDATKNRSRRWCDERTCGNRLKVRRFRSRQRRNRGS